MAARHFQAILWGLLLEAALGSARSSPAPPPPSTCRSSLPDDALTAALLGGAAARVDDCKATGRCPRAEVQVDPLRGVAAYRSQAFAGGLRVPADAAWDGEDWVAGLGAASWDAPPAASGAGGGVSAPVSPAAGLNTWSLGDGSLLPQPLHTPNFGVLLPPATGSGSGGGGAAGAPCVPDPAPVAANPYAFTAVTRAGATASNASASAPLPYQTRRTECAACLLHVDTDALVAVAACPPGLSASNGEVAPASLGTLAVGATGSGGWANMTGATGGLLVTPPAAVGGPPPPSVNRSAYPFVPPGWPFVVFTGHRQLHATATGSGAVPVPVAVFHFPSLHLGTGTAVAVRGSYPLALITRGSAMVNTPLRVEPGSGGGAPPVLLPSRAGSGGGALRFAPPAAPTRDLLFTLLLTAPFTGGSAASQRVVTFVGDGQTLRGGWAAAVCVRVVAAAATTVDSLPLEPMLRQCDGNGSGCACPPGYVSRTSRRITAGAEPDTVADALNVDLGLAALAAGVDATPPGSGASVTPSAVVVTRDASLTSGGFGYNLTFVGVAGRVPPLAVVSHLTGIGVGVTTTVLTSGDALAGTYRLTWHGAVTAPLAADASPAAVQAAVTAAFAPIGLLSASVAVAAVSTTGDACRLLSSADQRRRAKLGDADAFRATPAGSTSGGGGGGCAGLALARHGVALSITLTAALTAKQLEAAAAAPATPTAVIDATGGWAAAAADSPPPSWPAFFGPSAAYGNVLTLLPASPSEPTPVGTASLSLTANSATSAFTATTARVMPGHDADVAAASGGAPSHPFSTLALWRYFAAGSSCADSETAAALSALAASAGVNASAACALAALPPSVLAGFYPPPLWAFTSCRLPAGASSSGGGGGAATASAGAPVPLTGGNPGGLGAGTAQAWLARTPPAYLSAHGGGSWYAALGPGSNASAALRALAAGAMAAGNATGLGSAADALLAALPPEAWLAGGAGDAGGSLGCDPVLPPTALELLLARLNGAAALTAPTAYSPAAATADADAALSALRASCGYSADWRALPAAVDINGSAITAANASGASRFPGLCGSPPSLVAYLSWHAAEARLRLNGSAPLRTAPLPPNVRARWWAAALGLSADEAADPPGTFRALFNASAAPYDDTAQPPALDAYAPCCYGGAGGGVLVVAAGGDVTVGRHGLLAVDGQAGGDAPVGAGGAGGGGAGGSLLLSAGGVVAVRGRLSARGGAGGHITLGGGINATLASASAIGGAAGGTGGTIALFGQALSVDSDAPQRRVYWRRRLDVSGGVAGTELAFDGGSNPSSISPPPAAAGDGALVLAAAAPPGGVDYTVVGSSPPALDGLLPVPGRPVVAGRCNATAAAPGLADDGCSFGPCGALAAAGRSHVHGSGRALRVRAGRDGDDGAAAGVVHAGPSYVLPLRRDGDSDLRLLPSQAASGAFGSDAGYAAGVSWAARPAGSDAALAAASDATLTRLAGAWAAATAALSSPRAGNATTATAAASLFSAAAFPGEPAVANISAADADALLRAALWSPACLPRLLSAQVAVPPPAGCLQVAPSLPRPDRVTLYVRMEPPQRSAAGADAANGDDDAALSFGADDSADSSTASSPFASPRLPSHAWGAHIALHDDSALPGYGVWALGPVAWPPPVVLPLLPLTAAGNVSVALAALAAAFNVTAGGAFGPVPNSSWAALLPLAGSGDGQLSSLPSTNALCGLLAALQQSGAPSGPALAALLLGPVNATALCHTATASNSTAPTPLAWIALLPSLAQPGSGPAAAFGGGGPSLSAALSVPHPADAIAALPPPARDAVAAWYAAVDALRATLYPGGASNTTASINGAAPYAAGSPSDVLLGVAATVGAGGATLAWRHGAGYRSSVPPWRVPAHAVPPPLDDGFGGSSGAFVDPEEAGGAVLARALAGRAGLAAECGVPPAGSGSTRRAVSHWHKVDAFLDWAAVPPSYRLRVDDVTVVSGAPLPPGARGVTRIGLYATGGATVFYDGLYAGVDDTAGFGCPSAPAPGVDVTSGVPAQSGWAPGDVGPPNVAWAETHHDSHLSRREAYAHSSHGGLVWGDGAAHTAFESDVGRDAVRAATSTGVIAISGSGAGPTGANNSAPELLVLPVAPPGTPATALSAVDAAYGGSAAAYDSPAGALALATAAVAAAGSPATSFTPAGGLMSATLAGYAAAPPLPRRGGVSAGALLASPVDGRHYWYGEHAGASSRGAAAAYYRRWYHDGGIGACSSASAGVGDSGGAALRLWRAEGLLLRFANASLPARLGPLRPANPFTSERPEDARLRLPATGARSSLPLLPGGGNAAAAANASAIDPLAPPPLQLRLQRPKALWNAAAAARLAVCAASAWGVTGSNSNSTNFTAPAPPFCVSPPVPNVTAAGANATAATARLLAALGTLPVVVWAAVDDAAAADRRAAGIAGGTHPRGPLTWVRALRPSGNATVDFTVLQTPTAAAASQATQPTSSCNGTASLASAAPPSAPAFLARSYFASQRYLLPAPVMQPLWESVKEGATDPGALGRALAPSSVNATNSSNASAPATAYWYPPTAFALNYHRAFYHPGYDDPDDTLAQRWRREDAPWNVTTADGEWAEAWDAASSQFVLAQLSTGEVVRYSPADRAAVLAARLDRHAYRHVHGQGRSPVGSRYLDPRQPALSAWAPSSVPAVRAQRWAANVADANVADNPPHPAVPDLRIGLETVVTVRRAAYVAVSRLADDYLSLAGEVVVDDGDAGCVNATVGGSAAAPVVAACAYLLPASGGAEEVAVFEGTLEGSGPDGCHGADGGLGGATVTPDGDVVCPGGSSSVGPGWLADLVAGFATGGAAATTGASGGNTTTSAPPQLPFGWQSSPAAHAGVSTYRPDVSAASAAPLLPAAFATAPDWEDRHWQFVSAPGDRARDFRNFRDRQLPGPAGAACPDLRHVALLKYAECQALLDFGGSSSGGGGGGSGGAAPPPAVGPPPHAVWVDAPPLLDASTPTPVPRSFARGLDTAALEVCGRAHEALLAEYAACLAAAVPDWDGPATLPDWGVGARECVGGGGVCGPTEAALRAGTVRGATTWAATGGFPPFDAATAAPAAGVTCFAANGTAVPCGSPAADAGAAGVRSPSSRDLVREDRAEKGWPPG